MKNQLLLILTFINVIFLSCSKDSANSNETNNPKIEITKNITVDGLNRSFVIYVPETALNQPKMPLLFILHGGKGNPTGMMTIANFKPIADRDKVILVYPAGMVYPTETGGSWNDGRPTSANINGVNDVNFFSSMIDFMVSNYNVNSLKVYATGISNGGLMSARLGSELSSRITAFAAVAASEETTIGNNTTMTSVSRQVPALFMQGTLDPLLPFLGGGVNVGNGQTSGTVLSHNQVIAKWITVNNCAITPVLTNLPDLTTTDNCIVQQRIFTNPNTGVEVASYVVIDGGHTWPQGTQYLPISIIGEVNLDINACEVIWTFFKKFQI